MSFDVPPPDAQITTDLPLLAGRYQLQDQIGAGGMGEVFRARDTTLHRLVAVKILPPGKFPDGEAVARFRREALALAKLSHPHIIQAYDSGQDGDKHFLVMELVEGRSLSAELAEKGRLSPTRAADYARQAALALQHAHHFGLVHRDVKPSNLLLGPDGRVRLLDLGLARFLQDQVGDATLTRDGTGMGTPDYCSPEQFRDAHKADARSDIYSLGCTLYHLIAGKPPFPGSSLSEKATAHESREPSPLETIDPDIPGGLALVAARMLAKRPADRFASMAETAEALAPFVPGSSASFSDLRSTSTWNGGRLETSRAFPRRRRRTPWLVAGTAILLALVSVASLSYVLLHGGERQVAQPNTDTQGDSPDAPAAVDKVAAKLPSVTKAEPPKPTVSDDPNVLTVSKEAKTGGRFRTIHEALAEVKPGQTIRVLDDETYRETLLLNRPSSQRNITIETVREATLEMAQARAALIEIVGVSGVTVRNFHLRARDTDLCALVYIRENGAGVLLERLDMGLRDSGGRFNGVEVQQVADSSEAGRPQVAIRDCVIRNAQIGVNVMGVSANYRDATPVCGLQICNNRLLDCQWGVILRGSVRQVRVVGNRFHGCVRAAWQLEHLMADSDNILLANNTAFECNNWLRIWDDKVRTKGVYLANNLALSGGRPDTLVFDSGGSPTVAKGYGDGTVYLGRWTFSHNWREVKVPLATEKKTDGWVPPSTKDVCKERIDGINRDAKSPDFLRPAKDSPLATGGAGKEDPSLPTYIGALPPEGVEPWDWDRTWRMPKDAKLLTVSKEMTGGGKYRTINDALKEARPWATVLVLDDVEYEECLSLKDKAKFEGLTLEAPKRATLVMVKGDRRSVDVRGVPHLRISGFRFRDRDKTPDLGRAFLYATGDLTGTTFADLEIKTTTYPVGIALLQVASDGEPMVVTRCEIDTFNDSITVTGNPALGACRGVRVSANRVRATGPTRGILLTGAMEEVQVTGNLMYGCKTAALQIEDPAPSNRRVLLANNTICDCGQGFRLLEHGTPRKHVMGQVEFSNNILFNCTVGDANYVVVKEETHVGGDTHSLVKAWKFRGNARDLSGSRVEYQIPLTSADRLLADADLLSTDTKELDRIRPRSGSPLTTFGITGGAGLPAYVGALPPEGVAPWDWDRTWRTRTKSKAK